MQATPPPIRDIHAAAAPPLWPPAWGWWVLAGMLLTVAIIAAIWLGQRWRKRRRIAQLSKELDDIAARYQADEDVSAAIARIAVYLRRLVLHEAGQRKTVALTGQRWVDFLVEPQELEPHVAIAARDLISAPYQRQPAANVDSLLQLCHFWVRRVASV